MLKSNNRPKLCRLCGKEIIGPYETITTTRGTEIYICSHCKPKKQTGVD